MSQSLGHSKPVKSEERLAVEHESSERLHQEVRRSGIVRLLAKAYLRRMARLATVKEPNGEDEHGQTS